MSASLYQSILYDLSQLKEKQLKEVAQFVRRVAEVPAANGAEIGASEDHIVLNGKVSVLANVRRNNLDFLDKIEEWSDESFDDFNREVSNSRNADVERNIEW